MRFLCAANMYLNADLYSTSFETDDHFGMAISGPSENIFMSTKNRSAAVEHESLLTCETLPRPRWSSLIHIQALANVVKRPVISSYPDNTGLPYNNLFNREFTPLSDKPEHEKPIYILWTVDGALPHGMFTPNHFVWLRESPFQSEPQVVTKPKKGIKRNSRTLFDYDFVPIKKQPSLETADTENCHDVPNDNGSIQSNKVEETITEESRSVSSQHASEETVTAEMIDTSNMTSDTTAKTRELPD